MQSPSLLQFAFPETRLGIIPGCAPHAGLFWLWLVTVLWLVTDISSCGGRGLSASESSGRLGHLQCSSAAGWGCASLLGGQGHGVHMAPPPIHSHPQT